MSTEQEDTKIESTQQMPKEETDWFLQTLISIVNRSDFELGITLQVSGMLVSGSLVSGAKYFEGFAAEFSGAFAADQELAETIKQSFSTYGEMYRSDSDEDTKQAPPQYVHLKNARFFNTAGNPIPGNRGVWWRGRLSAVGGFILGSLSADGR